MQLCGKEDERVWEFLIPGIRQGVGVDLIPINAVV